MSKQLRSQGPRHGRCESNSNTRSCGVCLDRPGLVVQSHQFRLTRRVWGEGSPSPIRNIVAFASTDPIRVRRPTLEDELQDGGRSTALKRYFSPVDLENTPPGAPFGFSSI